MRRAVHTPVHHLHQGAVTLFGAAVASDIAAKACGAGKDMVIGLVQCKGDEPGPRADSFDRPRCRSGIRLAQIDEHDIGLRRGDFRMSASSAICVLRSAESHQWQVF